MIDAKGCKLQTTGSGSNEDPAGCRCAFEREGETDGCFDVTSKLLNIDRLHGRPGNSGYPGILGQVEGIGGQRAGGFTATFAALGAILDGLHRGHRK